MANEARLTVQLNIRNGELNFQWYPTTFTANVAGAAGPSPGTILVPVNGISVSFSPLTQPGLCMLMNLDPTNFVSYGIYTGADFWPLGEILPGEFYPLRISRRLGDEYPNEVGSGTVATGGSLFFAADTAPCYVQVQAFQV